MKGDKLVIHEGHINAAKGIEQLLFEKIVISYNKFILTIAGESGSGKSEIATVLSEELAKKNIKSLILQQDDYFVYPPKTNADIRRDNIDHVGLSEVRLDVFDLNLKSILEGKREIVKPLINFTEDRIQAETIAIDDKMVIIVEGTYTTALKNAHQHVFIDRTYIDTREARHRRAREIQDDFLEKILEIEHKIISLQRPDADIIVTKNYEVTAHYETGK